MELERLENILIISHQVCLLLIRHRGLVDLPQLLLGRAEMPVRCAQCDAASIESNWISLDTPTSTIFRMKIFLTLKSLYIPSSSSHRRHTVVTRSVILYPLQL